MRFATAAASAFASMAYTVSAFGVRSQVVATRRAFTASSSTRLSANVLKLSDPQTQLLDQVDVFIFDCDGVIWRVSYIMPSRSITLGYRRDHSSSHFAFWYVRSSWFISKG